MQPSTGLRFVPTHKSLRLARMQLDCGAVGLAVAKVEEAEVMATLGPIDLTIAFPAVGTARAQRIARLSLQQHPPKVGQRINIVPVNVSLCINLYNHFYLITRNGKLQKERVDARGCLV
jgi:D-serine deaminase-like pyridoxal phosphate-dependent protein